MLFINTCTHKNVCDPTQCCFIHQAKQPIRFLVHFEGLILSPSFFSFFPSLMGLFKVYNWNDFLDAAGSQKVVCSRWGLISHHWSDEVLNLSRLSHLSHGSGGGGAFRRPRFASSRSSRGDSPGGIWEPKPLKKSSLIHEPLQHGMCLISCSLCLGRALTRGERGNSDPIIAQQRESVTAERKPSKKWRFRAKACRVTGKPLYLM